MKKKVLFVFVLLSLLMVGGCNGSNSKKNTLSAPQEISVQSNGSKSLIVFDEVSNADYYNIYINDMAVTVRGNGSGTVEYDASKIMNLPQKYTIKIKAIGDNYYDSQFSEEYEYLHTASLQAPTISIDSKTLNWAKVENADFYDVVVVSSNPTIETVHRFTNNKFDFSNILVNKGEYSFKVRAVSEGSEFQPSIYSNEVRYVNKLNLITPYNVDVNYNDVSDEILLTFVSSENVNEFILNINGVNYDLGQSLLNDFKIKNNYNNLYTIRLKSFLEYKNVEVSNLQLLNISVKAVSDNTYLLNSDFSNSVTYQICSKLKAPTLTLTENANTCTLNFTTTQSPYLSGYAIYLNDQKYKTIDSTINSVELPLSEVVSAGIRVQAISNNNNCASSNLSQAVYAENSLPSLEDIAIEYINKKIQWNDIANATNYYVEIYNNSYIYSTFTDGTSIDLTGIVEPNKYSVKVIAFANGYKQTEAKIDIDYMLTLSTVENVRINSSGDIITLTFDKVAGAYGYAIYLQDALVEHIFTSEQIDIKEYISTASSYSIKVKAVAPILSNVSDGEFSFEQTLQNVKTLSSPILTISKEGDLYYLNVDVDEKEETLSSGYEIWINYMSIGKQDKLADAKIDVTSYFATAGKYNFMIQAIANENNQYVKNSNISSVSYSFTKQLDTVTGIKVEQNTEEGRYILTFDEQALVAKYEVTILKADDEKYNVKFEINNGFADISSYVTENGVYRVYVKALAVKDSFYTDSATSGNPFRFTKGLTLPMPSNITITKNPDGSATLSWNKIGNSLSYKVNIYYNYNGEQLLKLSTQTQGVLLNIGSGQNKCLNKEGSYTIKIKAIGNETEYESSQYATYSYRYTMESVADFNRNTISMYHNHDIYCEKDDCDVYFKDYNYNVSSFEQLQSLLWYHYLYNDQVWNYSETLEYNLKIYCETDLNQMALNYSEALYEKLLAIDEDETILNKNEQKMLIMAQEALKQYQEVGAWTLGTATQNLCHKPNESNVYIFRYVDVLNKDKLAVVENTDVSFPNKLDVVDTFEQRPSNYVFAIDKCESVDVTTTEQLFMAVQYGKKPNFIGDCEVAKTVYENARLTLRQLCTDSMSDYEKVLQMYEFLTTSVAYNYSVTLGGASSEVQVQGGTTYRGNVRDFYLEGVFYDLDNKKAVCDGLAKAFVLMCSIEGIDAVKVEGRIGSEDGSMHAWNKVFLTIDGEDGEGAWYNIDATAGRSRITVLGATYDVGNHSAFLLTDVQFQAKTGLYRETYSHKGLKQATTEYNYYSNTRYEAKTNDYSTSGYFIYDSSLSDTIDTQIKNAMAYGMINTNKNTSLKRYSVIVDMDISNYQQSKDALIEAIVNQSSDGYYAQVKDTLKSYNCAGVSADIIGNILVIVFKN